MIKYNNSNINDWYYDTSNIIKVYRNNAVCYYKIDTSSPSGQTPCFAVVDNISQYSDTEFEDVFNKADNKWYKLNNLNQYEEYGVYGSGRTITHYDGKLTIDGDYEYQYSGGSWVSVGEVSGGTIPDNYVIPFEDSNVKAICVNNWGGNVVAGELTYGEAKQVTDIGTVFANNTTIVSFNELAYFHGLTTLNQGHFAGCSNLKDIVIPSNVTSLGRLQSSGSNIIFRGCGNLSGFTMLSGDSSLYFAINEENGSYYMNSSHSSTPMVFPDRPMEMKSDAFAYYDYCYTAYFQSATPPTNLANSDINSYSKLQYIYCPVGSLSAYQTALAGKNKTIQEYDFEADSLGLLDKQKEWIDKTSYVVVYPMYYSPIQDPPNNLVFSSMTEAEDYECPWVGMKATIDGDKYVFSGDSTSGYEWVYQASRLPIGYTEVEYVENKNRAYLDTGFKPNQDTRIVCTMQCVTSSQYGRYIGAGGYNSKNAMQFDYESYYNGTLHVSWGHLSSWTTYSSCVGDYNVHEYDWDKNYFYRDKGKSNQFSASTTYTNFQCTDNLGIFIYINNGAPSSNYSTEALIGKMYTFQMYDNGTLIRDLVPCKRDSDNRVGAYDIVNDVFYYPPNYSSYPLVAGPEVE